MLKLNFNYILEGNQQLCYILTLTNQRTIRIYTNVISHVVSKGVLTALRRPKACDEEYLAVLDCGRVAINNLDPVIRVSI